MSNGSQIGRKKHLAFHIGKHPSGSKTDWNMHEFTFLSITQMREPNGENDMRVRKLKLNLSIATINFLPLKISFLYSLMI
ncbi:NAC domain containing protein [Trema orientale]|uniref:NAC domain containing protein n=1 Tax=Trema orientale TaxID=63057 RepID=A0A2P5DBM6_TREOI|nr:NAC domain containing protein [Trema orientale]